MFVPFTHHSQGESLRIRSTVAALVVLQLDTPLEHSIIQIWREEANFAFRHKMRGFWEDSRRVFANVEDT